MPTLLTVHSSHADQIGAPCFHRDKSVLAGKPVCKAEPTVSQDYQDVTSLANWHAYRWATDLSYRDFRNLLIADFLASWSTLTSAQQKILVAHFVYPLDTTTAELDALYTQAERDVFKADVLTEFKFSGCLILESNQTAGKHFCVEVDDMGTLTAIEITSDGPV